jgi:hypothetical protein
MALKPNKLQTTTNKEMQTLGNYIKLQTVDDMLRSFDLENENNLENIEE